MRVSPLRTKDPVRSRPSPVQWSAPARLQRRQSVVPDPNPNTPFCFQVYGSCFQFVFIPVCIRPVDQRNVTSGVVDVRRLAVFLWAIYCCKSSWKPAQLLTAGLGSALEQSGLKSSDSSVRRPEPVWVTGLSCDSGNEPVARLFLENRRPAGSLWPNQTNNNNM